MNAEAKITSKGQTTIPQEVRELLNLQAGDVVKFTVDGNYIIMTAKSVNFNDLAGFLGSPPNGPATLDEITETIAIHAGKNALISLPKAKPNTA